MPNLMLGMEFWLILRFKIDDINFDDFVDFVDFMDGRGLLVFDENIENTAFVVLANDTLVAIGFRVIGRLHYACIQ